MDETNPTHAVVAPDRSAARPNPDITGDLVRACAARVRVRLDYQSESGKRWSPEVHAVEQLTAGFEAPQLSDPVAELEAHLGVGWEFEVEVAIDAPLEEAGRWVSRVLGRLEVADADSCRLVGSTSNPRWYAAELARIPMSYKVIRGAEVRGCVREPGERLLAASAV